MSGTRMSKTMAVKIAWYTFVYFICFNCIHLQTFIDSLLRHFFLFPIIKGIE